MRRRGAAWPAWGMCSLSVALGLGAILLMMLNDYSLMKILNEAASIEMALAFPVVGALIASRHPRNAIGWIFCVVGLSQGLILFAYLYGEHAYVVDPGSLPGAHFAAWLSSWMWIPGFGATLTFLPLLFPTGKPPSSRWRPVAWLSAASVGSLNLVVAASSWNQRGERLLGDIEDMSSWFEPLFVTVLVCGLASVASLITRFRTSGAEERQQLKWFALACSGLAGLSVLYATEVGEVALNVGSLILIACIPAAVGIAMLRYRLYDIDVIINRTLVYGGLTALLAAVYAAGVFGLGGALRWATGQQDNGLAVAGSTLAVAALFRPARARIQSFIDRRFYRRRYDAAQTLQAFSARLRDEVDLDELRSDLVGVVGETMQPAHVSLLLLPASGTDGGRRLRTHD